MKRILTIFAVLISANSFAGLGDKGLHAPTVKGVQQVAAYPNLAKYLWALGQIESGNNDFAVGTHGERSRFQCMPDVWRKATTQPLSAATDAKVASVVTLAIIRARTGKDPAELTPEQFSKAWHCPGARRLNREQRDYIKRFKNLVAR